MIDVYERFKYAERLFGERRYREAATELEWLLGRDENSDENLASLTGDRDARLLLARAYFHSAQLLGAERIARGLVDADPTDGYALLLLGRSLQRQNRRNEATRYLRLARAMGEPVAA